MTDTVTPQELGVVLDIASRADVPLGQAYQLGATIQKLVAMANQPHNIGPRPEDATQTNGPATGSSPKSGGSAEEGQAETARDAGSTRVAKRVQR